MANPTNKDELQALCDEIVEQNGYIAGRVLPDGSIAILLGLMFTRAIALGVTRDGWTSRFCFEDFQRATLEFQKLTSEDDEPTGWVARR